MSLRYLPVVTLEQPWLSAMWPAVRAFLPSPPATVVEVGCGPQGGFVPALEADGYRAVGVDPAAPDGPRYVQAEYERTDLPAPADAIIASTSLHHVADPALVVAKIASDLTRDGVCVVIEYDWESFDQATAEWSFARLRSGESDSFLERHRQRWQGSQQSWEEYFHAWAHAHGLHSARAIVDELDRRFARIHYGRGPYLFPELNGTTEAEELEAIGAGEVRPLRIDYAGRRRAAP